MAKHDGTERTSPLKSRALRALIIVIGIVLLLWGALCLYAADYYRADAPALAALEGSAAVTVSHGKDLWSFDGPGEDAALIFYPGAKVEAAAYAPLLLRLAESGVDCFLVKMPYNMAIFGSGRAAGIMADRSYQRWYLGGHSLGGAMAASWAAKHPGELDGLVLLAAYPTSPLPEGLAVLSVWGSEDRVLSMDKLEAGEGYLAGPSIELELAGGNHAWFGSYGEQKGDGRASITHEEQWERTVRAVLELARPGQE